LSVEEGKAVKREKGKRTDYNPRLKVLSWKIADSFVKSRSPLYRHIYDRAKIEEAAKLKHPEKDPKNCPFYIPCLIRLSETAKRKGSKPKGLPCKKHIDYRARRKMVKRFLADLWAIWRSLEGLPVSKPYAVAILGHDEEPQTASNPRKISEPQRSSNPERSELSRPSNSNSEEGSEPRYASNPPSASEPQKPSNPKGISEPTKTRNPISSSEEATQL
jgi:hypothetical protein